MERLNPGLSDQAYFGRIGILVSQRKFDEAIAMVTSDLAKAQSPRAFVVAAMHLTLGQLHIAAGRRDQAQPFLLKADAELNELGRSNNGPGVTRLLLETHAALGRRQEVEREAPAYIAREAQDRWSGPGAEADAARAFAILGDRDRALSLLERLLVLPYADSLTPAFLRLDPLWDPIRNDPRFQKLASSSALTTSPVP